MKEPQKGGLTVKNQKLKNMPTVLDLGCAIDTNEKRNKLEEE